MQEKDSFSTKFNGKYMIFNKLLFKRLENLLKISSDICLLGPAGNGKSTLIQYLVQEQNFPSIKLNCLSCNNKSKVLSSLSYELANYLFGKNNLDCQINKDINKFNVFIDFFGRYAGMIDRMIVILDNFEKLDVNTTFFSHLFLLKKMLKWKMCFVLVGLTPKEPEIIVKNYEFSKLEKITIPKPSEKFLNSILYETLISLKNNDNKKEIGSFLKNFLGNFMDRTIHLDVLINLAITLYCMKGDMNYKSIQNIFLENPQLQLSEIPKKLKENERKQDSQGLKGFIQIRFLPDMPIFQKILLIACFFGETGPEKFDRIYFKNLKQKTNRKTLSSMKKEGKSSNFKKPVNFFRLISLAQSLISFQTREIPERECFDQTSDFYANLNDLVEKGYIQKISNFDNEVNKMKFLCNVEKSFISKVCEDVSIKFDEFFHSNN